MQQANDISIRDILLMFRRRIRLILTVVLVGTTFALLLGLTQPERYTASALLLLEPRDVRIADAKAISQEQSIDTAAIETHIHVLMSRDHTLKVVDHLKLVDLPEFQPPPERSLADALNTTFAFLAEQLSHLWLAASRVADKTDRLPAAFEPSEKPESHARPDADTKRDRAANIFRRNLWVAQMGKSLVLQVSFIAFDPALAALIANTVSEDYVTSRLREKRQSASEFNIWLDHRLTVLRDDVLKAEAAVESLRADNHLVHTNGIELNQSQLAALNTELVTTRSEKFAKLAKLRLARSIQGGKLDTMGEVINSPLIASLREVQIALLSKEGGLSMELGSQHPVMIKLKHEQEKLALQFKNEVARITTNLENEVEIIAARENALRAEVERLRDQQAVADQVMVKLRQLEREASASRSIYEVFLSRFKQATEQERVLQSDVRLVSRAAPPAVPDRASLKIFVIVGLVASTVVGSTLAILLEANSSTIRSSREIETLLGATALGLIPSVGGFRREPTPHRLLLTKPRSAYAEYIRSIYARLYLRSDGTGPRTVCVTSCTPAEGKSTLVLSLATLAAESGLRTLVIDLDLRYPSIHERLGLIPEASVVDVLSNQIPLHRAVLHDPATGVDCLPAWLDAQDPSMLLTPKRTKALLLTATRTYDRVLIDAPPLCGISDAQILASNVEQIVFVVKWCAVGVDTATTALRDLTATDAKVAGVVLSFVNLRRYVVNGFGSADLSYYYQRRRHRRPASLTGPGRPADRALQHNNGRGAFSQGRNSSGFSPWRTMS